MRLWGIYLFILSFSTCTLCLIDSEVDPREPGPCPEHWVDGTLAGLGCLLFNSTEFYTWQQANVYCQKEENATLLEIWTSLQSDFISNELMLLEDHESPRNWWTGGTDIGREGEWYWVSSGASVGDFVWASYNNEPNGNTNYNCMILSPSPWEYKGNDIYCTNGHFPICQKK